MILIKEENTKKRLCCKTCLEFKDKLKLSNVVAHEGSPSIQMSSLSRHNESNEHKSACKIGMCYLLWITDKFLYMHKGCATW